ncbi:hypothetical protein [Portibacter lacus]|uniref:SRPBCC family protein n=1 Tax=Portibacter lacus TaxID=1099794 RepID=A0AA37WG53_9BACT|nr:hypothetical protein [Portibacter lacus]GLR19513.1 hypothetical protein GCM10007940_41290 [Portibacter lacus]
MKVLNIHRRTINEPIEKVAEAVATVSTPADKIWPNEHWPAMKFKNGIGVGEKGGHGPIRYTVEKYQPSEIIQFQFTRPKGFNGIHKLELKDLGNGKTEISHTIDINTSGKGTWLWIFGIRSLHDALLEDAFDKLENNFTGGNKKSEWSAWVKFLRRQMARSS